MKGIFYFVLCVNLLGGLFCVTEDDIRACQENVFGVITCTSVSFYRECVVPGAVQIYAIKQHRNVTPAFCEFKTSFGFRGNAVWVTHGCSGEFYLCYDGVPMFTKRPLQTVTSRPFEPTSGDVAVVKGSSALGDNDVWIYVIVTSCVVLLVGIGLVVGCVVKRRQQNDKSRRLAEKRQIRIELKEHREHMEENGATMLPLATRSLSVESINYGEPVNLSYGSRYEFEKEGSICSSRSSNSEMTSLSTRTTGYLMKPRPSLNYSMRRMHNGILKKGISTPDISVLGKMYCEANMSSKNHRHFLRTHSKNSLARCSQSSLESVREVCNKYQIFDIPLERKLEQRTRRPSKYNTVSFGVGGSQRTNDSKTNSLPENARLKFNTVGFVRSSSGSGRTHLDSMRSLPGTSRKTTKAIVHIRSPSVKDLPVSKISENNAAVRNDNQLCETNVQPIYMPRDVQVSHMVNEQQQPGSTSSINSPRDIQYHDPVSLIIRSKSPEPMQNISKPDIPEKPIVTISTPDSIYKTVDKSKINKPVILPKPKIMPKPSTAIYATVNKSYFKAVTKAEETDGVTCSTFDVMSLEDDEDDVVSVSKESQYARLEAFKPASVFALRVPTIKLPGVSTDDTKI